MTQSEILVNKMWTLSRTGWSLAGRGLSLPHSLIHGLLYKVATTVAVKRTPFDQLDWAPVGHPYGLQNHRQW